MNNYTDMKTRAKMRKIESDLAEKANVIDFNKLRQGSISYGLIKLPNDFPVSLPFNLWRDLNGRILHDFDFTFYETATKTIYIDRMYGSDTTGDGTTENPYKLLKKALEVARDAVETDIIIKVKTMSGTYTDKAVYYRDEGTGATTITITNKRVSIVPDTGVNEINITGAQLLSWTSDENVWKATRSGVYGVINLLDRDFYGIPNLFAKKATLAECKANSKSWYTDGTYVWVNTSDGLTPTLAGNGIMVLANVINFDITLVNSTLYLRDINFLIARNGDVAQITGDINSTVIHKNCKFAYANYNRYGTVNANGLAIDNVGKTYGFGSIAAYSGNDGFNYHYVGIPVEDRSDCLAFEYQCIGYNNGVNNTTDLNSNGATTAHEGVNVLRVEDIGFNTNGPVCADAHGCYSIMYDCHMRDSVATDGQSVKSSYYFYNTDSEPTAPKKAILINCDGGGEDTYSCNTANGIDVTLQAFRGFNFPSTFDPIIKS